LLPPSFLQSCVAVFNSGRWQRYHHAHGESSSMTLAPKGICFCSPTLVKCKKDSQASKPHCSRQAHVCLLQQPPSFPRNQSAYIHLCVDLNRHKLEFQASMELKSMCITHEILGDGKLSCARRDNTIMHMGIHRQ